MPISSKRSSVQGSRSAALRVLLRTTLAGPCVAERMRHATQTCDRQDCRIAYL